MREIKFRAWQDNIMLTQPISSVYGTYRFFGLIHEDNTNIMQFTGLQDKNGKDIYEGDKVEFTVETRTYGDHYVTAEFFGYVVYSGSTFKLWNKPDIEFFGGDGPCALDKISEKDIEVIGNIYENPELLEES